MDDRSKGSITSSASSSAKKSMVKGEAPGATKELP